ncbi:chemotaxis protein [Vibrio cortegadensis]|uniref:chemotaxis protein n=1 Tax=Vibrio cortegadensis TaxID=1328770 RepID=UPI00352BD693
MGGKSKSSNSTTTTNVSGQNAISGDNLGTAISGVNDSTINVTATDHGAIGKAFDLGELVIAENSKNVEQAYNFGGQALEEFSSSNSENLQTMAGLAGSQAKQNAESLEAVMKLAKFKQDNGQSESETKKIIAIVIVSLVIGGVVYKGSR